MHSIVHLILYGHALAPLLFHQEVLGLPRLGTVLEHEYGPVVVDGVPARREAEISVN